MATKTKVHPIEAELVKLTSVERKAKESEERFQARLARAVGKLDKEVWDGISDEAQLWVNAAAAAMRDKEDVPDFSAELEDSEDESEDEESEDEEEEEDEDESEDEEPKKKDKAPKSKKEAKPSKEGKSKGKGGGRDLTSTFRRMAVEHPDLGKDEIMERMAKKGLEISNATAQTILFHTRQTLKALEAAGFTVKAPK